jgi:hypothetical protein
MVVSRESVRFYWQVTDRFRQQPGRWRMDFTEWTLRCPWPSTRRDLMLRVDLEAGLHHSTGRLMMMARVGVKGGKTAAFSRAVAPEISGLADVLRRRRFRLRAPMAYYPLSAWKKLTRRSFAPEREFLSTLASLNAGETAGQRPSSLAEFLDSFRGTSAGDWRPLLAAWEYRRAIRIGGRPATAILKLHIAPADLTGRRLGAASSVTIWPPWSGQGAYPAWLQGIRRMLGRQYRAAGHEMKWFRGPKGRGVMITSLRDGLKRLPDVVRERRVLESLDLRDMD